MTELPNCCQDLPAAIASRSASAGELAAYDALPLELRRVLQGAPIDGSAIELARAWREAGRPAAQVARECELDFPEVRRELALHDYGPDHPEARQ